MDKPTAGAERTALYRFYAAGGKLLYVGITKSLGIRWNNHANLQPWWPLVDNQTVQWLPGRKEALVAEKAAIAAEMPLFNIAGVPRGELPLDDETGFYVRPKRVPRSRPRHYEELPAMYQGNGWLWPYERVAADIRAAIRAGELKPGEQLPPQPRLAQMAGVSKSVVQGALALLAEEGLVYARPKRGTFVAERTGD